MVRRVAWVSILATLVFTAPASAQLRLPAIFAEHMILQRGAPDPVWGWAAAGALHWTRDESGTDLDNIAPERGEPSVEIPCRDTGECDRVPDAPRLTVATL